MPFGCGSTCDYAGAMFAHMIKPRRALRGTHDVPYVSSGDAVGEIGSAEKRGGGEDDGTQFDQGQSRFPKRRNVSKHDHDAIASPDA